MVNVNKDSLKNILVGEVISDKMNNTIVVRVERTFMHPRYKKVMRSFKKYKVHDESEKAKIGDFVEIFAGRPVSKTKYMYLNKILNTKEI